MRNIFLIFIGILFTFLNFSCQSKKETRQEIYFNNFESNNLSSIENGKISFFNKTKVLGNYNNGGFALNLIQLPNHVLVEITFDLYIHDSWDGNKLGGGIDGPDLWKLLVNETIYVNTTFSNNECFSAFCSPQSYPNNYPNNYNNPKSGSSNKDLPGFCSLANTIGGSSAYKIKKTIIHHNSDFHLQCLDQLVQTNVPNPLCDESWSVDNLKIILINLN